MKAVSFCLPLTGGIYRVFVDLRRGLRSLGIELSWLASGRSAFDLLGRHPSAEDLSIGTLVAPDTDDELPRAARLLDYIHREKVELVIFNVLGGPIDTNVARHLPGHVLRILIVHSITPATYRAAHAIRDHVHAIIGVSPRIASDLVARYGFDPDWTIVIPNAVDIAAFARCDREPSSGRPLRVLSLGRVEDISKGVHWIPTIFRKAAHYGADLKLTIAGDGPDLAALRHRFARVPIPDGVSFPGSIPPGKVAALMTLHHYCPVIKPIVSNTCRDRVNAFGSAMSGTPAKWAFS